MSKMSFLSFKHGSSRKPSLKQPQLSLPKGQQQKTNLPSTGVFQANTAEMKQVFDKFDCNKDGKISREEYKLALRAMGKIGNAENEVAKAFQVLDADGDGFIDFKEFMEVHKMGGGVNMNEIQSAFGVFDLDGDGKISAAELLEVLRRLGERCSLETCRKMVKGVDRDGDGLVDMDEFMIMMTRNLKFS